MIAIISSSRASNSGPVFDDTIRFPEAVRLSPSIALGTGGGGGAIGGGGGAIGAEGGGGAIGGDGAVGSDGAIGAGGGGGAIGGTGGCGGGTLLVLFPGTRAGRTCDENEAGASRGDEALNPAGTGRSCTFGKAGPEGGLIREGGVRAGEMRAGDVRGDEMREGDVRGGEIRAVAVHDVGAFEVGCDTAATSLAAVGASGTWADMRVDTEPFTAGGERDERDCCCEGCEFFKALDIILL